MMLIVSGDSEYIGRACMEGGRPHVRGGKSQVHEDLADHDPVVDALAKLKEDHSAAIVDHFDLVVDDSTIIRRDYNP